MSALHKHYKFHLFAIACLLNTRVVHTAEHKVSLEKIQDTKVMNGVEKKNEISGIQRGDKQREVQ